MARHSCLPWLALRIDCPEGLLQAAAERGHVGDALPDDREEIHQKSEAPVPRDGFELERIVLVELERQAQAKKKTGRQRTVERLRERDRGVLAQPVLTPADIKMEAVRSGQKGPQLRVQLAAALAVLAVGGAAALAIPGTVRAIKSASRGVGGGVGFRVNDAARIKRLLSGGAFPATGGGDDFQGLLG